MARRFSRGRFRKKRSVSWIAGVTTYDPAAGVSNRLIGLAPLTTANVWGASIGVVIPSDLPLHGGEDAVLTRIVGRLGFMDGRKDAGAGAAAFGFQMRVTIAQSDFLPAGIVTPFEFIASAGMGSDDILFESDVIVPNQAIGAAGAGYDLLAGGYERWLEIDTSAKRKVQEDRAIIIWFQTVLPAGTNAADFRLLGGLRSLLMRPV